MIESKTCGKNSQGRLEQFFAKAIPALSILNSAHLGVRSSFDENGVFTGYIGGSDTCPRKAVLSRRHPVEHSLETQLRFAWGHLAQELFSRLFRAGGLKFQEEVEIVHPDNPRIKCHIDFLFKGKGGAWYVVEKKATDVVPDEPYSSWVDQLQFQMGMLKFHPDFKDGDTVAGSILAAKPLSKENPNKMLNGVKEFGSFLPNDLVFHTAMNKRLHILDALDGKVDPACETGFLCGGYCPYFSDCPSHSLPAAPLPMEVVKAAGAYVKLSEQKRMIERLLKEKKNELLSYTGSKFQAESCGVRINAYATKESVSVDSDLLKKKYPEIYKEVCKPKAASQRLDVDLIDQGDFALLDPSFGDPAHQSAA